LPTARVLAVDSRDRAGWGHPDNRATQGGIVPTIIVHHDVDDTEHWLASPKREEFFGTLGITNLRTFSDPQNPTHTALMADVPDLDALMAALQTEEALAAMKNDGVHGDSLVFLVET
jgi:hypothetical protein